MTGFIHCILHLVQNSLQQHRIIISTFYALHQLSFYFIYIRSHLLYLTLSRYYTFNTCL